MISMKSKTIGVWMDIVNHQNKEFKEYFEAEENYLKSRVKKNMTALDIGCGNGRSMKPLAPSVKRFAGIDNDSNAVKAFKEDMKGVKNAEIFPDDAERTHFKDKTFDVVFIGLTFCNFGDTKQKILSEIKRILKDDGKFVFSVYSEDALGVRKEMYDKINLDYKVADKAKGTVLFADGGISEQFSKGDMEKILSEAGFEITDIVKGTFFYFITSKKA